MNSGARIIPVASGKGGVGKSLFTSNLAMALAQQGHDTIVVDLDLGGSNLHTFLGLNNEYPGVGDFLLARNAELEELLVPTAVPNLRFLPGDGRTPFMANITHAHKGRLARALQRLQARYILLDLSAGSSYNTLDLFGLSDRSLLVTTPDLPSIMNMLVFMKNFVLREISRDFAGDHRVKEQLKALFARPMETGVQSLKDLVEALSPIEPQAAKRIEQLCGRLHPRIIFNMGDHPDDLKVVQHIDRNLRQRLSVTPECLGFLFFDPAVRTLIRQRRPLLTTSPESVVSKGISRIARRLDKLWGQPIEKSGERLLLDTRKTFELWKGAEQPPQT